MTSLDGNLPSSFYTPGEILYFYLVIEARVSKVCRSTYTSKITVVEMYTVADGIQ